jgi:HAD superfamily hydrolase (TIGR01484 family)
MEYMRKFLITLDVDGTLLNKSYKSTSSTINSTISQLTDEGHTFLLNSNRSLEDLLFIAKTFDMTGPLIPENGSYIYHQESGKTEVLLDEDSQEQFKLIKEMIPEIIEKHFSNAIYFEGDTTDINKHIDVQDIPSDKTHLFITNQYRKYTVSIHVKKVVDDQLEMDVDTVEEFYKIMTDELNKKLFDFKTEFTKAFANLLILPTKISKLDAFNHLTKQFPKYSKIIISDDEMEKPARNEMDYFFVVSNGSAIAQEMADYVSPESVTKGVEDILLKLDKLTK